MRRCLVAVVDGSKARFLTLNASEFEADETGSTLVEQESLHSAENEMHGQDLWANTRTGRNRGSSGQAHSYDDHRTNHIVEFERRFAQSVTSRMVDLVQMHQMHHLILVAEPQILGMLRNVMASSLPQQLTVYELPKDLCRMSITELHTYLAERSLIPAFKRAGV